MNDREVVDLLHGMVGIASVSGEEEPLARWLVERMARLGFDASVDGAGNAVGVRAGAPPEDGRWRDVVLLGHIDTVPGAIPVRVEDGVLHGRGAVDAKGPFATFVAAAARVTPAPGVRLHVIGAVEEEASTSKGARHVLPRLRPDLCLIGEPSGAGALTLGYKGRVLFDVTLRQDGGHGAGPIGSVAERAFRWWSRVERHAAAWNDGIEPLFDRLMPSLRSIATSSDGLVDEARMTCGFRLPPDFDVDALARALASFDEGAEVVRSGEEPAWSDRRSGRWARAFTRVWRRRGETPRFKRKTGTSDLNVLGPAWRCPIAAYGPGDSTLDHTPHERIDLAEVVRAVEVLEGVLVEVGAGEGEEAGGGRLEGRGAREARGSGLGV